MYVPAYNGMYPNIHSPCTCIIVRFIQHLIVIKFTHTYIYIYICVYMYIYLFKRTYFETRLALFTCLFLATSKPAMEKLSKDLLTRGRREGHGSNFLLNFVYSVYIYKKKHYDQYTPRYRKFSRDNLTLTGICLYLHLLITPSHIPSPSSIRLEPCSGPAGVATCKEPPLPPPDHSPGGPEDGSLEVNTEKSKAASGNPGESGLGVQLPAAVKENKREFLDSIGRKQHHPFN